MQGGGSSDEREEQSLDAVVAAAQELLGEERFGGVWLDRWGGGPPLLGIAAVDPSQEEVDAMLALEPPLGWRVSIVLVRYSRAALIAFSEGLAPPTTGAAIAFGWDPRVNRVVVRLTRLEAETVRYFRRHIPDDALRFVIEPSGGAVAYTDLQGGSYDRTR
jgi:hypothetical protein